MLSHSPPTPTNTTKPELSLRTTYSQYVMGWLQWMWRHDKSASFVSAAHDSDHSIVHDFQNRLLGLRNPWIPFATVLPLSPRNDHHDLSCHTRRLQFPALLDQLGGWTQRGLRQKSATQICTPAHTQPLPRTHRQHIGAPFHHAALCSGVSCLPLCLAYRGHKHRSPGSTRYHTCCCVLQLARSYPRLGRHKQVRHQRNVVEDRWCQPDLYWMVGPDVCVRAGEQRSRRMLTRDSRN